MDSFLSPALRELLAAIFAKDPGARPTAGEILTGTWMTHGGGSESAPVANAARIAGGREMLAKHRALLQQTARRFGVQPRFIVAFWGLESNYGKHTGAFPLIGAVATLAHDPRRSRL